MSTFVQKVVFLMMIKNIYFYMLYFMQNLELSRVGKS